MISYKEYEKKVFDWLMSKHEKDNTFTFSVRQKGSKDTGTDYFIGTEKSKYFSTNFWNISVGYPGSSSDLINLVFSYDGAKNLVYHIQFTQTKNPDNEQNEWALQLVKNCKEKLKTIFERYSESEDSNKMEFFKIYNTKSYTSIEDLIADANTDIEKVIPIVDAEIGKLKEKHPTFKAHRFTLEEQNNMFRRMEKRFEDYKNADEEFIPSESTINFNEVVAKFSKQDLDNYFSFLNKIITSLGVNYNDKRVVFSIRENRLNFIIGKRYCWNLYGPNKKGKFGVNSKDIINEFSDNFDGDGLQPFYTQFDDFDLAETHFDSIIASLKSELERTNKSNYRKWNNIDFENRVFNIESADESDYKAPLNQILYGPPGTGKTYNTVLEAAKIVLGHNDISYDEALKVFNDNLGNQIEFITFHQNYSYEDFIQGLRPDTENGSNLTFEKKDGVFKRIADRALKNLEASKNPAIVKKDFDVVFSELIKPLNDGDVNEVEIKMKKSSFFITEIGEKSIEFRKSIGDSEHTLSINTLRKMYERGTNDIILGGLQPYYNPILDLLLEKGKNQITSVDKKNYVIIIDEINRANISRVFGELITLIEEDKRSHGKIPMRVTLPSGDSFIVPSNLYIIGTMNTADKSIALLDIALRRRFEFVPKYPDITLESVYDKEILSAINTAILDRKNHDFTIGHAYFMGDDYSREKTINNKVLPLLLEYFMNDEKEVVTILKSAGIEMEGWPLKMKV